ncbi:GNAT family N-acetyltransferase [Micromonospora sp. NPDC005172]|uniref:GNAT family N-acetyltransferase n=1 Tax=Micromonospora sp. NPDC005172 TaxID=3156867 RepID=UPI0033BCA478
MTDLRFTPVQPAGSALALLDWQHIHNSIIPTAPLSADEIVARAQRNILEVAYVDGTAVGCSTVRPPAPDAATVIARVLPGSRRRGYGEQIYQRGLTQARELGATAIETVVLASNDEGLRFARQHGFVETDRYVLPGDTIAFVDLRLA